MICFQCVSEGTVCHSGQGFMLKKAHSEKVLAPDATRTALIWSTYISLCCAYLIIKMKPWDLYIYTPLLHTTQGSQGWLQRVFLISGITGSHQQLNLSRKKWTKQNMNLSIISFSQPDFPAYLQLCSTSPRLLLPIKTTASNFTETVETVETSNLSRHAWSVHEMSRKCGTFLFRWSDVTIESFTGRTLYTAETTGVCIFRYLQDLCKCVYIIIGFNGTYC